ncbi:MAG: hypothetical protein LBL76_07295 [Treponema sp.]|jgi:hypothetical protein|nr:hypothetical protein [Treponema sp.]
MALLQCTVCDENGDFTTLTGKSVPAGGNYTFYAIQGKDTSTKKEVQVTMPVGGNMGLFRFPRVGESVLIGQTGVSPNPSDTTGWVLLSYFIQNTGSNAPFYPADSRQVFANENQLKPNNIKPDKTHKSGGYLADQMNPATMQEFLHDNGMAIRYLAEANKNKASETREVNNQQTPIGTANAGKWSEIGFYNKKAKWPDSVKTFDETDKGDSLALSRFDRQDVINIQSSGDIESRAENYHLIKAKRFELLANTDELSPELRAHNDRSNWKDWDSDQAPLGNHATDDSAIHSGDVHIRAGKNIVIKAVGEIRLQVGRTVVVIDDNGFTVTSRKINANTPLTQDTTLSLKARGGIDMFGENVNIASSRKFSIADAWGGSLVSMVGMVNLSGIQIKQTTYGKLQQVYADITNTWLLANDITLGGMAATNEGLAYAAGWVKFVGDAGKMLINNVKAFYDLYDTHKNWSDAQKKLEDYRADAFNEYKTNLLQLNDATPDQYVKDAIKQSLEALTDPKKETLDYKGGIGAAASLIGVEPIETVQIVLNMILDMTNAVYLVVENAYARSWRSGYKESIKDPNKKSTSAAEKSSFRNTLNLIAMSIDGGIIDGFLMGITALPGVGGPASIRLRQSGDIIIKAGENKHLYAELSEKVSVPASIWTERVQWGLKFTDALAKAGTDVAKVVLQALDKTEAIPSFVEKL